MTFAVPARLGWRAVEAARAAATFLVVQIALLAGGACGPSGAEEATERLAVAGRRAQAAVAVEATLEDSGVRARLALKLTAPIDPAAFALANPDRVLIDASGLGFALDADIGRSAVPAPARRGRLARPAAGSGAIVKPGGLIASFRFGRLDQTRSRIVIDLSRPARIVRAGCETGEDGAPTLVVELVGADRASFLAAAQSARAALARPAQASGAEAFAANGGRPLVMIDPGHGGIDRGAAVNSLVEKDLVLDFAKALAARLEADGRVQAVLTRDDDSFIALGERVRLARARRAALFISVHADILSEAADVSGATVYTASDRASDAAAARLAEKENQADAAAGVDHAEDVTDVSDILFDLTRRETRGYSHVFARTLLNYWKVAGRLNKNPQRAAGFRVLMAPDVPSVLLELGYLSNEKDDAALSSPQWREKAVARMAEAIDAFFAGRGDVEAGARPARDLDAVGSLIAVPLPARDGAAQAGNAR